MEIDFITNHHKQTKRDYLARVNKINKSEAAIKAKKWDFDYWDGSRDVNYGGYYYDGRWEPIAKKIIDFYKIKPGNKILDIGCGKGFLLYELKKQVPGVIIRGLDISSYAIKNAKEEVKEYLEIGDANKLPYYDKEFDLVLSVNTLHNLYCFDLFSALQEIERVGKEKKYLCVESYRNETEKVNLLYWQVTCEAFFNTDEWKWIFNQNNYRGDYSFIFFE